MRTSTKLQLCAFATAMIFSLAAHSFPGESIMLDPVSGNYNITYWNESMEPPGLEATVFVPATKIVPTIQSRFSSDAAGKITYRYTVSSATQSKQTLIDILLDPVSSIIGTRDDSKMGLGAAAMAVFKANEAAITTPSGWIGTVSFGGQGHEDGSIRTGWLASVEHSTGLKPGGTVRGFGFSSYALPGIIVAELSGDSPVHGWSGEGPGPDSAINQQLTEIETHDFVPRSAAVPTIAVPSPFSAATLLDRIQAQTHTWIGMQLLDASFSSQLDRYLVAAANAYRYNQPKAGKEHIETLRRMLKKEHEDLDRDDEQADEKPHGDEKHKQAKRLAIDRLAARVLDFDLKYVLKRMGDERD